MKFNLKSTLTYCQHDYPSNSSCPFCENEELKEEIKELKEVSKSEKLLSDLFDEKFYWRGHELSWCSTCETFSIHLKCCDNGSCTGGGCSKCCGPEGFDSIEFNKLNKNRIEDYLNDEEKKTYRKVFYIKKYIPICLAAGFTEINWTYLHKNGYLCPGVYKLFKELEEFKSEVLD